MEYLRQEGHGQAANSWSTPRAAVAQQHALHAAAVQQALPCPLRPHATPNPNPNPCALTLPLPLTPTPAPGAHHGCLSISSMVMRFLASTVKMRLSRSLHSGESCRRGAAWRRGGAVNCVTANDAAVLFHYAPDDDVMT
jgi:hypothetical protein